ncbi:MAG TPA: hypothetical protein VKN18_07180 [Blastocatellia bacterium]|nr:hypothetical protein [Blastocatellia bacterium]
MIRRAIWVIFLAYWCLIATGNPSSAGQSEGFRTARNRSAGLSNDSSQNGNPSELGQSDGSTSTGDIYSSIAPPFLTPGKNLFVTREGDPFVVTVTSTCFLEDESESQFELLSPAPDFIHVSESYRREIKTNGYAEGIGIVYVTPQIGDAGKYVVTLQVKACNGRVERVVSFKVHIKPAI